MQPFCLTIQLYHTWFGASCTFWSLSSNTPHCTPLECRRDGESCSIDISLLRSENQTTKEHFSRLVIERKMSVTC